MKQIEMEMRVRNTEERSRDEIERLKTTLLYEQQISSRYKLCQIPPVYQYDPGKLSHIARVYR